MRELIKSMLSFSWAMSLFGFKQFGNALSIASPGQAENDAVRSLDSIVNSAEQQMGEVAKGAFMAGDRFQRSAMDLIFGGVPSAPPDSRPSSNAASRNQSSEPGKPGSAPSIPKPHAGRLNVTSFVVIGEGLAAGMGDFTLSDGSQTASFPAWMARQMGAAFEQLLIQPPGVSDPLGFSPLPVRVPAPMQTSVLDRLPPTPVSNLSIPSFRITDAVNLRPSEPLIHRNDAKQTLANLVLGIIPMSRGEADRPTAIERALQLKPTFALIELGYFEALEAAIKADVTLLPEVDRLRSDFGHMLTSLKQAGADVLVLTIPDPLDTAYFSTIESAAKTLRIPPEFLVDEYRLNASDLLTANGLNEIGYQIFANALEPLPWGSTLSAETALEVRQRVSELNAGISSLGRQHDAPVYDLQAFFRRVASAGVSVGSRRLIGEYLGGFYSLNGYYPGETGHALIANELLHLLNKTYGADFPQIDLRAVLAEDPVANYRPANGPAWTSSQLQSLPRGTTGTASVHAPQGAGERARESPRTGGWEELEPAGQAPPLPLRLPPDLGQVLPLNKSASYFGDGIAPLNCRDQQGIQWGSCGSLLFGGLAMVDSHLTGSIRIKFSPPANNLTQFQVSFLDGFVGDDAVLVTPQFFKMAFQQSRVDEVQGQVSSGTLNLATGEVSDLKIYARYSSTALFALVSVNPTFPKQPLSFPGQYGSAWAKFEQRSDGKLDFTFYGSTFVPLGKDILWPLNFTGPSHQFATIPAAGTVMHPHLSLSTKGPPESEGANCLDIPFNTIQELTLFTHNSAFGDAFTLQAPELGGPAKGRSHVLGRAQIQFGGRCGDSVPIAVSGLTAGGIFAPLEESPITQVFPGRLYHGPHGFNEFLRFPLRTYSLDDLAIIDDPFDIAVGAVSLKTGRLLNEMLHRGFINQDLIFALLRVEPRTPKDSFFFRGPAKIERGANGHLVYRFQGIVHIPYPEGFFFPSPNLTTGFPVGADSALDPFLWIHAIEDDERANVIKRGEARNVLSSSGELFSYSFAIPADPARHQASFEYENHSQKGRFRLHSLSWVGFGNSGTGQPAAAEYDTVTFTGFGIWSKDGVERLLQASVQISTSPDKPYVGIQIDSADVSDVNTKPENEKDALP